MLDAGHLSVIWVTRQGKYIANLHPAGSEIVKVAWFPGPEAAGWVQAGDAGFRKATASGAVEIVAARYGDTGKVTQTKLLKEVIKEHPNLDYVAGTAVTADAAVSVLRKEGLSERVGIVSYYLTPGVYRGIRRGKILATPTDSPVIQGRIAMDQIVRVLENREVLRHVGPKLEIIDRENILTIKKNASLAPSGFHATFTVH